MKKRIVVHVDEHFPGIGGEPPRVLSRDYPLEIEVEDPPGRLTINVVDEEERRTLAVDKGEGLERLRFELVDNVANALGISVESW